MHFACRHQGVVDDGIAAVVQTNRRRSLQLELKARLLLLPHAHFSQHFVMTPDLCEHLYCSPVTVLTGQAFPEG